MNDPSSDSGEFDFSNLAAVDIERIEVLRGPQSALYGSDAMGGVIDIITRKGKGAPRNQGRLGSTMPPIQGLSIEPSVVFVGSRFSSPGELYELAPYARLDVYADYKINDTLSIYARAENLTDARYQEVYDYGTAGRSFYAGLRATW